MKNHRATKPTMKPDFCLFFFTTSPHHFSGLSSKMIIRVSTFRAVTVCQVLF